MNKRNCFLLVLIVTISMLFSCNNVGKKIITNSPEGEEIRKNYCECLKNYQHDLIVYGNSRELFDKHLESLVSTKN